MNNSGLSRKTNRYKLDLVNERKHRPYIYSVCRPYVSVSVSHRIHILFAVRMSVYVSHRPYTYSVCCPYVSVSVSHRRYTYSVFCPYVCFCQSVDSPSVRLFASVTPPPPPPSPSLSLFVVVSCL